MIEKQNSPQEQDSCCASADSGTQQDELVQQLAECNAKYLRLAADMENMRRRTAQEQQLQTERIKKQIFLDLLPIIDNFERALQSLTASDTSAEKTVRGISLIHTLLEKMLQKYGVTEIEVKEYFNPDLHEAIMHVESPGKESGQIVQVLEKGYMQNGSILRPARVSVAK